MLPVGRSEGSTRFEVKVEVPELGEFLPPGRNGLRDGTSSRQELNSYPSCAVDDFPVATSEGSHPFPSRTRKLSPPEPMVLRGKPRGRVGRRRVFLSDGRQSPP